MRRRGTSYKALDISGKRFGRLVAVAPTGEKTHRRYVWSFKCDCGNIVVHPISYVTQRDTKSCGCWRRQVCIDRNTTHGKTGTPEYALWAQARQRSKKSGMVFDLTPADIIIPDFCPLLGTKLLPARGLKRLSNRMQSPSIDRIDSKRGYVRGNVWVISFRANAIKNNATLEELEKICAGLRVKLEKAA